MAKREFDESRFLGVFFLIVALIIFAGIGVGFVQFSESYDHMTHGARGLVVFGLSIGGICGAVLLGSSIYYFLGMDKPNRHN